MTHEEMIEQLENTILLIKQNGKDWFDERDIPILETAIKAMQTQLKESPENFNKPPETKSMLNADLISRQAVYQELSLLLSDWDDDYNKVVSKCLQAIDNVPSVQPEQRWIPVTKRLPEDNLKVFVSTKTAIGIAAHNELGWYVPDTYFDGVIAWMPLPEPFKAESEDKE